MKDIYVIIIFALLGAQATGLNHGIHKDNSHCIERISRHVHELATSTIHVTISFKGIVIPNNTIHDCMEKIEQQQSFVPLIETWDLIKRYYNHDEELLCQFCILLLLNYHCVINEKIHTHRQFMFITLISLYAQLNAIPLAKLFEVLEECLQKYNEIADTLAPYENVPIYLWIQNNWWVPTALTGFTIISYLKWRKGRNQAISAQVNTQK